MTTTAWGTEILVNTNTAGDQSEPTVTALADGRFVVTWSDLSGTLGDGSLSAIHAQVFNADGSRAGAELLVNTTTLDRQFQPAATGLDGGRFVVTWSDLSKGSVDYDVRAQIFNPDGTRSGGEFVVNTQTANSQVGPAITALAGGRFVATWTTHAGNDVHAQVFNADGTRSGTEFLANSTITGGQQEPTICTLSDGRFVIAWRHEVTLLDQDIRAQIFNADGSKSGAELTVDVATALDVEPSITALADGGFVVSWSRFSAVNSSVQAQVFDANGAKSGADFLVNTTTAGYQYASTLAALPDGRFVAAWADASQTGADVSGAAVRAQVFNADGTKSGTEFLVNTATTSHQEAPSITVLADGRREPARALSPERLARRPRSGSGFRYDPLPRPQSGRGGGRHRSAAALPPVRLLRGPRRPCGGGSDRERLRRAILPVPQSRRGSGRRRCTHALQQLLPA